MAEATRNRDPLHPLPRVNLDLAQAERLRCHFKARLLYTRHGCRGIQEFTVDVIEISRTHLVISSPFVDFIPDNFTLTLGARQHGMGCAAWSRVGNRINCKLLRPETPSMIAFLSLVRRPEETVHEIRNPLFARPRFQSR